MARRLLIALGVLIVAAAAVVALKYPDVLELFVDGESRTLREPMEGEPVAPDRPDLLIIALDGVDQQLLYELIRGGRLPGLASLYGGPGHAYLDETAISVLPSSTLPAWASVLTGTPPGIHGITGNEYFAREERRLVALAPTMFKDPAPTLAIYADDDADRNLDGATVYERLRADEPGIRIWVSMGQFHRGADRLLLARREVIGEAMSAFLDGSLSGSGALTEVLEELDEEVLETVLDALEEEAPPDVLTLYVPGPDMLAHQEGPGARARYLVEVVDPMLGKVAAALDARGALDDRFVVVLADHGHSAVARDDRHAVDGELRDALGAAGFRVRRYAVDPGDEDYQAVVAGGGATAFVYLADRSTCAAAGARCDWSRPPRLAEDVFAAAEALRRVEGVDLVLTRRPRPFAEDDEPLQLYLGGGRLGPLRDDLRPGWVDARRRLDALATGRHGERAGDLLLVARWDEGARWYFSQPYLSWHGSPTAQDSRVPLVLGHRRRAPRQLEALVRETLGPVSRQEDLLRLFLRLRRDPG